MLPLAPREGLVEAGEDNVLSQTHWLTESEIFLLSSHCAAQTAAFIYSDVPSQMLSHAACFCFYMYLFV